ncbi:hypothetical protein [Dictyobacter aurantiacus]|uniref:hypothetical protein n=1 Tax=Dictyobacter aurantiacus TaxID=1936993 RepID=UPI000F82AA0A|nr:hypothetical protein [Dictyobacter aurantiacus]
MGYKHNKSIPIIQVLLSPMPLKETPSNDTLLDTSQVMERSQIEEVNDASATSPILVFEITLMMVSLGLTLISNIFDRIGWRIANVLLALLVLLMTLLYCYLFIVARLFKYKGIHYTLLLLQLLLLGMTLLFSLYRLLF